MLRSSNGYARGQTGYGPVASLILLVLLILPGPVGGQTPDPAVSAADQWFTNRAIYPANVAELSVDTNAFAQLRAESLAGKLRVTCAAQETNASLVLWASAGHPGHWPARDWRVFAMSSSRLQRQATVPVDNVDEPVLYFVVRSNALQGVCSRMRICHPRALGLEEPSRIFWSFQEGFEEGMQGWSLLADPGAGFELKLSDQARTGRQALEASVPAGKRSVTVATTRLQGGYLLQHGATGIRLWLRSTGRAGRAKFTLLAHAFTDRQVIREFSQDTSVGGKWTRVDLPFELFPDLKLAGVDLFAIELIGAGPERFLLDDVQLLGPWPLE